jgi:predicted HAD superfamily phosphohydrolase YqeG
MVGEVIDVGSVERLVQKLLGHIDNLKHVKNKAACFDVDETLLFWNAEDSDAFAVHPLIKPLYDALATKDYKLFIITARPKTERGIRYVARQMMSLGYDMKVVPTSGVYMQPKDFYEAGATGEFKLAARKHIIQKYGVKVVLMVGDQFTDLFHNSFEGFQEISNKSRRFDREKLDSVGILVANPDEHTALGLKLPSVHH